MVDGIVLEAPGVTKRPKPQPSRAATIARTRCTKCQDALAQAVLGNEKRCSSCLQTALHSKITNAVKVHKAIVPGDVVAVAISGGPCSTALLDLLNSVRNRQWTRQVRGQVRTSHMFALFCNTLHTAASLGHVGAPIASTI